MITKIFTTLLIFLILSSYCLSQDKKECIKTFKFRGPDVNGVIKEVELVVKKRFTDFSTEQKVAQMQFEKSTYGEFDYTFLDEPSELVDCAGYVMNKLWGTGDYRVGGPNFTTNMIKNFGQPISGTFGWGPAQKGDIVVYERDGIGNHITYVSEVSSTLGVTTSVTTETKDGSESVYTHTLPDYTLRDKAGLLNDPLIRNWGIPNIYRIDPKLVTVSNIETECDGETNAVSIDDKLSGNWYKPGFTLIVSGGSGGADIKYIQDPISTAPNQSPTIDPRKFSNVKIEGDKITGRFESDPMYEDTFLNKKAKISGTFEMRLVESSTQPGTFTLEGSTVWDSEYCKGCMDTWVWARTPYK